MASTAARPRRQCQFNFRRRRETDLSDIYFLRGVALSSQVNSACLEYVHSAKQTGRVLLCNKIFRFQWLGVSCASETRLDSGLPAIAEDSTRGPMRVPPLMLDKQRRRVDLLESCLRR